MFTKLFVLLWKELGYYIQTTLICSIFLTIAITLAANLKSSLILQTIRNEEKEVILTPGKYDTNNCINVIHPSKTLVYAPSSPFLQKLMEQVACLNGYDKSKVKVGFEQEFSFGFEFKQIDVGQKDPPKSLEYVIFPTDKDPSHTSKIWAGFNMLKTMLPHYEEQTYYPTIARFQIIIDRLFLEMNNVSEIETSTVIMDSQNRYLPTSENRRHYLASMLIVYLLFFLGSFIFLYHTVLEKTSRITEFLNIMGFRKSLLRLASFLSPLLFHFFIGFTFIVVFSYVPLKKDSYVFQHVHPGIMVGYFILSALNSLGLTYCMSFFFQDVLSAIVTFGQFWSLSTVTTFFFGTTIKLPHLVEIILDIVVPPLNLFQSFILLSEFEYYGKSVKMNERLSPAGDILTIGERLISAIISIFLYVLLGAYFENVLPGKYGIRRSLCYCFTESYWSKRNKTVKESNTEEVQPNKGFFEEIPPGVTAGISVKNLSKIYGSKTKGAVWALNNVSVDFYEGEITGLLGHNGAGKTTLISIITGMMFASFGSIKFKDPNFNWKINIGYCPQDGIFFEDFSVRKNIIFFGMAKNLSHKDAMKDADELVTKLGLLEVKNKSARFLSGGQRRKLSLAIALVARPKVLILDEPSTGIDVSIRREIWDLLLELRGSKTIILSTHIMEEADAICDNIAVLAHGEIKCYGSPMFLKSKFGTGYSLSVVAANLGRINAVTDLVKKHVKGAKVKYQNVLTVVYELSEKDMVAFPDLFETMDARRRDGEIISYNVAVTTMEDVFLSIDKTLKEEYNKANIGPGGIDHAEESPKKSKLTGPFLLCYQILALLIKNWIYLRRNWITFFSLFVILIAVNYFSGSLKGVKALLKGTSSDSSVAYNLSTYGEPEILYSSTVDNNINVSFHKMMTEFGIKFHKVDDVTAELIETYKEDFWKYSNTILTFEFSDNKISVLYSRNAVHAFSIALNLLHNMFLNNSNRYIKTSMALKYLNEEVEAISNLTCSSSVLSIPQRLNVELVLFLLRPLEERNLKLKIYQLMLASPIIYWLSNLVFDLPFYFAYAVIIFGVVSISDQTLQDFMINNIGRILVGLLLTVMNLLALGYIITSISKDIMTAFILTMMLVLISSFISRSIFPNAFKYLKYLSPNSLWLADIEYLCLNTSDTLLHHMVMYFVVLQFILIILDLRILHYILHKFWTIIYRVDFSLPHPKDPTVEIEDRVVKDLKKSGQLASKTLVVDNVKRWYDSVSFKRCSCVNPAVKEVSFTIDKAECFGLVGTNGAGKSTIFNIITGVLTPSRGKVYLKSISIQNCLLRHKTFFQMGYCSQSGNYFPYFKGREMLTLFGRLRGLRGSHLKKEVDGRIQQVSLEEDQNKNCKTYSGGTLRKLATALAVIGDPIISLLDEPTSGLDPASRRFIWELIKNFRESGRSMLLTSHSMDECEALCTRLAMITNGQLRCVGEATSIKHIFGQNYTVLFKLSVKATEEDRLKLKKAVEDVFKTKCTLFSEHLTVMRYQIAIEAATWKKLFSELNSLKSKFLFVEFFSASSTTLEEIFLHFVND